MFQHFVYSGPSLLHSVNLHALSKQFNRICVLDSNEQVNNPASTGIAKLIALGSTQELIIQEEKNALQQLQQHLNNSNKWWFGFIGYDIKNELENLVSENKDEMKIPALHFFSPMIVMELYTNKTIIHFDEHHTNQLKAEEIIKTAINSAVKEKNTSQAAIMIQPKITKEEYLMRVIKLQDHIRKGDIYEINFCQEFFAGNVIIEPVSVFEKLNTISTAPFAAYCNFGNYQLICSSPERFLKKTGKRLLSQPIKGTIKRSSNPEEDTRLKKMLQNSEKERNENVMIVDLVRNDLSRIALRGTVKVDELFGIYSFQQVHQMISTISCEVAPHTPFSTIIQHTFPMGSMTGAPKIRAMQLIEQYEESRRGVYSGTLGYIQPNGDFDFNVIIRSIVYHQKKKHLSFMVGSAITDKAIAEQEYDECLLKAKALLEALEN